MRGVIRGAGAAERTRAWLSGWWIPLLLAATVIAINPVGYLGGGSDDSHYLEAARCWVEHGTCLPASHWAARWPAVVPLAAVLALVGESRATAALVPLLWWLGAVILTALIGQRLFGRRAGVAAALLLVLVPIFADAALGIGADVPELTFQLAAVLAGLVAVPRKSRAWAIAAGAFAALAFETRETSAAFLAATVLVWLIAGRREARLLLWSLAGFAAVIGIELVVYGVTTGDIFYRYELSLHHGGLVSSELDPSVDRTRSPILNPAFIAGWKREMGIHLFWPLDPWLNLIVSPRIGPVFMATLAAALLWWKKLPPAQRRWCWLLIIGAIVSGAVLIYVLAIDPKPRMFLGPAAAAALVLGALVSTAWADGPRVPAALLVGGLAALELVTHARTPSRLEGERVALGWIAAYPGQVEIDGSAADVLTLNKEARALPPRGSRKPLLLALTGSTCSALVSADGKARVVDAEPDAQRGRGGLCLLRY